MAGSHSRQSRWPGRPRWRWPPFNLAGTAGLVGFGALAGCWLAFAATAFHAIRQGDGAKQRRSALGRRPVSTQVSLFDTAEPVAFSREYLVVPIPAWVPNLVVAEFYCEPQSEEYEVLRQRLARLQLPIFFVLAYAITWSAQIPAYIYAHNHGYTLTNEQNLLHLLSLLQGELDPGLTPYLLIAIFAFGPTVAGIIVTGVFHGKAGLQDLWRRLTHVRVGGRWILVVLLLPLGLALVTLAVTFLAGGLQPINFVYLAPLPLIPLLLLYMLIFTGLAEEVGWRGYALPELQKSHTAERASWILGIAWGWWHIPALLLPQWLRGELNPGIVIAVLLGITFGVVGWTIVITWIYNNTQSVFWIILLHGWNNTIQSYLVLSAGFLANVIFALLPWAVAIYVLRKYGRETLIRNRDRTDAAAGSAAGVIKAAGAER